MYMCEEKPSSYMKHVTTTFILHVELKSNELSTLKWH